MTSDFPSTYAGRPIDYRTLAGAIAVFVGGYLVSATLSSQLSYFLGGRAQVEFGFVALLVLQALFAVAVVLAGLALVRASITARLMAGVVVVLFVVVAIAAQSARLNGNAGAAGIPLMLTLANSYFMAVLATGAAWLIVRSARIGWFAILASAILIPMPYAFIYGGVASGIMQSVLMVLAGLILAGIILAGRPLRE